MDSTNIIFVISVVIIFAIAFGIVRSSRFDSR
jgi:hypothetical protein